MSLYPLLYCFYIVISSSELLLHCYTRYCTAPTSLYPVLYCSYIVISGSVLLLHRYIRFGIAPISLYPVLHCSYIVITGNILLLHRYIRYCTHIFHCYVIALYPCCSIHTLKLVDLYYCLKVVKFYILLF
jgi:hypothetical protein